ncbi:MAG: cyclase family protein [Robiginitalea sp.]
MKVIFNQKGTSWKVDLDAGVDVSVPVDGQGFGVRAWRLQPAEIGPHREGDFIGSVKAGASVNFNDISFNPHAHGTHTEGMGHITPEGESLWENPPPSWLLATLVSIEPEVRGTDRVVSREQLEKALSSPETKALVLRTLPNPEAKKHTDYSGTNPPYLDPKAVEWLCGHGVEHLLLDLPSVDREEDGGALAAHKAFWGLPKHPRPQATITEFIYVPQNLEDGMYLLNLQVAAFNNDACPSRPVLFPLERMENQQG